MLGGLYILLGGHVMVMREKGEGGEDSVCLITFLFFRLLESVFRNSAKCLVMTGKILLIPVNNLFTCFL